MESFREHKLGKALGVPDKEVDSASIENRPCSWVLAKDEVLRVAIVNYQWAAGDSFHTEESSCEFDDKGGAFDSFHSVGAAQRRGQESAAEPQEENVSWADIHEAPRHAAQVRRPPKRCTNIHIARCVGPAGLTHNLCL